MDMIRQYSRAIQGTDQSTEEHEDVWGGIVVNGGP